MRWRESVAAMWDRASPNSSNWGGQGAGPMVKRIAPDATVRSVVTMDDIEARAGAL
ncbi:hypothetical protein ACFSF3_07300 [Vibrio chagasii]